MNGNAAAAVLLAIDTVPDPVVDSWLAAMPAETQARAGTFRSRRRCRQFVIARHLLATLLREQLGSAVGIVAEADGRPRVTGAHCSIAHSGGAVMAGFSLLAPIGVDIEQHRPRDVERLVMTYFHPREQETFATLESAQRQRWFYRAWTRKEACAKASGQGLTLKALASPEPDEAGHPALSSDFFQDGSFQNSSFQSTPFQSYSAAVAHDCCEKVTPGLVFHVDGNLVR